MFILCLFFCVLAHRGDKTKFFHNTPANSWQLFTYFFKYKKKPFNNQDSFDHRTPKWVSSQTLPSNLSCSFQSTFWFGCTQSSPSFLGTSSLEFAKENLFPGELKPVLRQANQRDRTDPSTTLILWPWRITQGRTPWISCSGTLFNDLDPILVSGLERSWTRRMRSSPTVKFLKRCVCLFCTSLDLKLLLLLTCFLS